MRTQRRRRPPRVRPTLEPCEAKVLLSTVAGGAPAPAQSTVAVVDVSVRPAQSTAAVVD
jgi:hypothetical protein